MAKELLRLYLEETYNKDKDKDVGNIHVKKEPVEIQESSKDPVGIVSKIKQEPNFDLPADNGVERCKILGDVKKEIIEDNDTLPRKGIKREKSIKDGDAVSLGNNKKTTVKSGSDGIGSPNLRCSVCLEIFLDEEQLEIHCRLHKGTPYSCPRCNKKFEQRLCFRIHFATHCRQKQYHCPYCKQYFPIYRHYVRHFCTEDWIPCEKCGEKFASQAMLMEHKCAKDNDDKDNGKSSDNQSTKVKIIKVEELLNSSSQRSYTCHECGNLFHTSYLLWHHAPCHRTKFKCFVCDKMYKSITYLRNHLLTHNIHQDILPKQEYDSTITALCETVLLE